jgi:4-amino-4-deoxy-L-arabinose transferase-like glycosyltransferase
VRVAILTSKWSLRWAWGVLAVLVLLGAVLRLWRLGVLPPGLWYDEAVNGLDARMVVSGAGLPLYFTANNGREPLFIYLQAISVALLQPTPFALRIVSAFVGILTIPATYFCARMLLRADREDPEASGQGWLLGWTAIIAAAIITISYWHLTLSRIGFRAIMLPLVSALALAFFWRGWTEGRRRDYVWSGVCFGLALYTYTAARLLPIVLVAFIVLEALLNAWRIRGGSGSEREATWRMWRHRLAGLGLLLGICVLVAIPLGITTASQPDVVLGRSTGLSVFANAAWQGVSPSARWQPLIQNLVRVARDFYDQGDLNLRHNLPGRPVNDPLLAGLFTLGLLSLVWGVRRPSYRLLVIWLGVMLLPTVLSPEAPHSLRAVGAIPPLALICAVGAYTVLRLLPWRRARRYGGLAFLALIMVVSGVLTFRDYFFRWSTNPGLGEAFSVRQQLAAEAIARLLQNPSQPQRVLVPDSLYGEPEVDFALGSLTYQQTLPPEFADGRDEGIQFVLAPDLDLSQPMHLVWRGPNGVTSAPVEPLTAPEVAVLSQVLGHDVTLQVMKSPLDPGEWPKVVAGPLPAEVRLRPRVISNTLDVNFENGVRLVGYDVRPDRVDPGKEPRAFTLTLFWEVDEHSGRAVAACCDVFVHLTNSSGVWETKNNLLAENQRLTWESTKRTLQDVRAVPVPPQMPPGKAHFEVGIVRRLLSPTSITYDRINIVDPQGRTAGDRVDLGSVMVGEPPPQADLSGLQPLGARFEDRIELIGWNARTDPGDPSLLLVDLGWRALDRSSIDYTAFVHLLDAEGRIASQQDEPPGGVENPTSRWVPGETVRTAFALRLPPGSEAGDHRLRIGLYEPVSGRQLPLTLGAANEAAGSGETFLIVSTGK